MIRAARKRMATAKAVPCPECGSKTYVKNSRLYGYDKVRYRDCSNCEHKFKTSQDIRAKAFPEEIIPYEELSAVRQQNCIKGGGNSKLTINDVRKIRSMWEDSEIKDITERMGIAEKFKVTDQTIQKILSGRAWAFVS